MVKGRLGPSANRSPPSIEVQNRMRALVTGATGFVGSNLVRHLIAEEHEVRAMARASSDQRAIDGLDCEITPGDLGDRDSLDAACRGVEIVFNVAALYDLHGDWSPFYETNVLGTRRLLAAAYEAGVRRVVHTSSGVAVGSAPRDRLANEESIWDLGEVPSPYSTTKFLAEVEVLKAVAAGFDAVIVNPAAPIGEWDWKPTATGQIIVRHLKGQLVAMPECFGNFVDVRDVVSGHLLAAQHGRKGERYLLTGANLDAAALGRELSRASGRSAPRARFPGAFAVAGAVLLQGGARVARRRTPVTIGSAALLGKRMFFDCSKAVSELGYAPSPIQSAFSRAVVWYRAGGYAP